MDLMEIRRGLLMAMAKGGVDYVSGTFTVPSDAGSSYTINFGKSFSNYLYLIEMTDASKETLIETGITSTRTFCMYGKYPIQITGTNNNTNVRVNPSTGDVTGAFAGAPITSFSGSGIGISVGNDTSGTNYLYKGYSYNYYIFSLDNI